MTTYRQGKRILFGVSALLFLAACGRLGGGGESADDCAAYLKYGELRGKEVSIFGSIRPPQDASYIESFKSFEACTGVKITYEGSQEFEARLPQRVAGGDAPDLAMI
ncbi:MAG: carbohydrate ABC transporter substrate-binding protein, partial [Angustibacter sp.]